MWGRGKSSLGLALFRSLKSTHTLILPSFLGTGTMLASHSTRIGQKAYGKPLERATLDVGRDYLLGALPVLLGPSIPGGKVGGAIICSARNALEEI